MTPGWRRGNHRAGRDLQDGRSGPPTGSLDGSHRQAHARERAHQGSCSHFVARCVLVGFKVTAGPMQRQGMTTFTQLAPPSGPPEPFAERLRLAVARPRRKARR
jgi:hypothetical protein